MNERQTRTIADFGEQCFPIGPFLIDLRQYIGGGVAVSHALGSSSFGLICA